MRSKSWIAALALVAVAGTAFAQADVIAQRREGLKRMGGHMEAFKPVADARGDVRALVPRIDDMITFYRGLPARFPAGSGTGDTKALPVVWTDSPGFEAANTRLLGQLEVLKTTASAGDAAGFATAYPATGPQFCGGCHRTYRGR
jgi:cytochrome c556